MSCPGAGVSKGGKDCMMLKLLSNLLDEPDLTSALNSTEQAGLPSAMADGLAGLLLNEPT